jgi:hypothetical protein
VSPLDGPAHLYTCHFRGSIQGERVHCALRYFLRRIERPLIVVWNHLHAHRARRVRDFVAAHPEDYQIEWPPPYTPDLNPEELRNEAVKT